MHKIGTWEIQTSWYGKLSTSVEQHPTKYKRYIFPSIFYTQWCLWTAPTQVLLLLTCSVVLPAKEVFAQIIQTPVTTLPVVDNWVQNNMMWYRCCQFNTGQLLFSCFTRTLLFSDQSLILPFEKLVHWAFIRLDILCYQDWFDWQARIFCAHPLEFWPFSGSGSRCLPGAVPSLKAPTSRRANVGFGVWPSKFADDRPTCVLCMQETADAIVPRNWPHRPGNAS